MMSLVVALSIFNEQVLYDVIRFLAKLKLTTPFTPEVAKKLEKITVGRKFF